MTKQRISFDNTAERVLAKPGVPVMKIVDGRACWLEFGKTTYRHEPELERIWRAGQRQGKPIQLELWERAA